jgi:toxin FitB
MELIDQGCVIDTNILIYHLTDCLGEVGEMWLEEAFDAGAYVSVITRIEILGWSKHSAESLHEAAELLTKVQELSLSEEIIKKCIQLRQTTSLKLPDAIIAATALHLGRPLMTRNIKDFQAVSDLVLLDPFSRPG